MPSKSPEEAPKPRLIDRQNRVALPAEVMKALGVKSGDYLAFDVDGAHVTVHKVKWSIERR